MKRIVKYLAMTCLSLVLLMGMSTSILGADASLTASTSTVRAGDTITLSLKVTQAGALGLEGVLEFDKNQVSLVGDPTAKVNEWEAELSDNNLVVYDNTQNNPLTSKSTTVVTLKFKVNSNVAEGTQLNISINNLVVSDGNKESTIGKVTYSTTVQRPLSGNANLGSLSVAEGTLSPAFKPGTTTYDIGEVEYSVKSLGITCTTEDENATFAIKDNSLKVGKNTVSITVTAENGNKKTYKINVTRKQDPNYVAGSNANLKSLTVSQGILSPKFNASVTDYIVYLPFESIGTSFTASGSEADSKAQGVISGTIDSLVEGKNQTVVVCRAEDGTEKNYVIVVYVMPKYEGVVPNIGFGNIDPGTNPGTDPGNTEDPSDTSSEEDTQKPTEDPTEKPSVNPSEKPSDEPSEDPGKKPADSKDDNMLLTILVIVVVIALVGALIYVLFFPKKKR